MARILAISSQVARGHVGLSAVVPALQALGHDVVGLPTMLLSNHPGHAHVAGHRVSPDNLLGMLDALTANGWLTEIDAVLTGYLPSPAHVAFAAAAVARLHVVKTSAWVVVDPVLGDDPKGLYIDPSAAEAIRDALVPLADVVTPNRFELGWLTGRALSDLASVAEVARTLGVPAVAVTSAGWREARSAPPASPSPFWRGVGSGVPEEHSSPATRERLPEQHVQSPSTVVPPPQTPPRKGEGGSTAENEKVQQEIVSLLVSAHESRLAAVPWREQVPHGTGDLLAALVAGHLAADRDMTDAFARAIAGVDTVVVGSVGRDELDLVAHLPVLAGVLPWPTEMLP